MKKVLCVGVYNPKLIHQASPVCGDNMFAKGFEANNYEVVRFDYRATSSPNEDLIKVASEFKEKPSIVWFGKAERISVSTVNTLRQILPDAVFCKWAADIRIEPQRHDIELLKNMDWFFGTMGGDYLKKHLLPNMKGVCSIIAFTDSDFYYPYTYLPEKYKNDIVWTGRRSIGNNHLRNEVIEYLDKQTNARVYGLNEWLGQPEYNYAISGAKIGIGVNSFNHTVKWSSDRLGNYMSSGTFYLCHDFGGIEEIFKKGYHLDWFQNIDEMKEKIDFYLKHDELRKKIARQGYDFIRKYFDYRPLVENILHVINFSKSKYEWDDLYTN